jgi:hypothetical protein
MRFVFKGRIKYQAPYLHSHHTGNGHKSLIDRYSTLCNNNGALDWLPPSASQGHSIILSPLISNIIPGGDIVPAQYPRSTRRVKGEGKKLGGDGGGAEPRNEKK